MLITAALGIGAFLICATWSLQPLGSLNITVPDLLTNPDGAPIHEERDTALDQQAFAIKLWHAPPQSIDAAAASIGAPKPPNLQLIGIINEGGTYRAAVYDADADRLVIVANGDRIGKFSITTVTPSSVELSDGQAKQTLALLQERS